MQEKQKFANEITTDDLNPIYQTLLGRTTTLTNELIQEALDPSKNAQAKKTIGGSNTDEVKRQLDRLALHLERDNAKLTLRKTQVQEAKENLERLTNELAALVK